MITAAFAVDLLNIDFKLLLQSIVLSSIGLFDSVDYLYHHGAEDDVDAQLYEEVYAGQTDYDVGEKIGAACPRCERLLKEQQHADDEDAGVGDGGDKRR